MWAKGLIAKGIHEEMRPGYSGMCLSRKAVHRWVERRGKRLADDEVETGSAVVAETTVKTSVLGVSTHW
jgi:hypothetical protein